MLNEQKIKTLQMLYAAALADSVVRYGNFGILDDVAEQKRNEQFKNGKTLAERFGVQEPCDAFLKTADTYGCANWECEKTETGFTAKATNCMLCAISKNMGQYSPCKVHCLSPIEAMVKGVAPDAVFENESTLWDGDCCAVKVIVD